MQIYSMFYLENKTKNPHKKAPTYHPGENQTKTRTNTHDQKTPKQQKTNKKPTTQSLYSLDICGNAVHHSRIEILLELKEKCIVILSCVLH